MELRHLRYFVGVVENEGYREASRVLHVAQPALSQRVIDLEEEIGTPLLVRDPKTILLTPAGRRSSRKPRVLSGKLSVRSTPRAAPRKDHMDPVDRFHPRHYPAFSPEFIRTFKESHPHIDIQVHGLTPAAQLVGLETGSLDLAFTRDFVEQEQSHLSARPIFQVPLVLFCRTPESQRMAGLPSRQSPAIRSSPPIRSSC